jgi:hypothetical protein
MGTQDEVRTRVFLSARLLEGFWAELAFATSSPPCSTTPVAKAGSTPTRSLGPVRLMSPGALAHEYGLG